MGLLEFLLLLLIAGICGAIAQALAGYTLGGFLVSAVVGFVGALIGAWLARQIGLPELFVVNIGGQPFPILWSILGGALFALAVGLIRRGTARVV